MKESLTIDEAFEIIHRMLEPYKVTDPHYDVPIDVYKQVLSLYEKTGLFVRPDMRLVPPAVFDPIDNLPVRVQPNQKTPEGV